MNYSGINFAARVEGVGMAGVHGVYGAQMQQKRHGAVAITADVFFNEEQRWLLDNFEELVRRQEKFRDSIRRKIKMFVDAQRAAYDKWVRDMEMERVYRAADRYSKAQFARESRAHRLSTVKGKIEYVGKRVVAAVILGTMLASTGLGAYNIAEKVVNKHQTSAAFYLDNNSQLLEAERALGAVAPFLAPTFSSMHNLSKFDLVHAFELVNPDSPFRVWRDSGGFAFGDYAFHQNYMFPAFLNNTLKKDAEKNGSDYYSVLKDELLPIIKNIKWDNNTNKLATDADRRNFTKFKAACERKFSGDKRFRALEQEFLMANYQERFDTMKSRYGFDITKVGELSAGLVLMDINNAYERCLNIMNEMTYQIAARRYGVKAGKVTKQMLADVRTSGVISKISEAEFADAHMKAVKIIIPLKVSKEYSSGLIKNYERVNRHYITPNLGKIYTTDEEMLAITKAAANGWVVEQISAIGLPVSVANDFAIATNSKINEIVTIDNFNEASTGAAVKDVVVADFSEYIKAQTKQNDEQYRAKADAGVWSKIYKGGNAIKNNVFTKAVANKGLARAA